MAQVHQERDCNSNSQLCMGLSIHTVNFFVYTVDYIFSSTPPPRLPSFGPSIHVTTSSACRSCSPPSDADFALAVRTIDTVSHHQLEILQVDSWPIYSISLTREEPAAGRQKSLCVSCARRSATRRIPTACHLDPPLLPPPSCSFDPVLQKQTASAACGHHANTWAQRW